MKKVLITRSDFFGHALATGDRYKCSSCSDTIIYKSKYCPGCGAKVVWKVFLEDGALPAIITSHNRHLFEKNPRFMVRFFYSLDRLKGCVLNILSKIKNNSKVSFAWYDIWVGVYWDRKDRILYICPFPMVLITVPFESPVVDPVLEAQAKFFEVFAEWMDWTCNERDIKSGCDCIDCKLIRAWRKLPKGVHLKKNEIADLGTIDLKDTLGE